MVARRTELYIGIRFSQVCIVTELVITKLHCIYKESWLSVEIRSLFLYIYESLDKEVGLCSLDLCADFSQMNSYNFSGGSEPDDLAVLQRHLETTRFLAQKVMTPALVAIGVTGNAVNIAVLTRRWMRSSSTNCYLTALAVHDVLYLVLVLVLSLNHYESVGTADWYVAVRIPLVRPLTNTCSNTGVWLTLTFTVERYIGVGHPMKGKVWCTPRRAKVIVAVVCLLAALVTSPEFFDSTTAYRFDGAANATVLRPVPTRFGLSRGYAVWYKYANQAMFTFLPLAMLAIFNALLVKAVVSAARWRHRMNTNGADAEKRGDVIATHHHHNINNNHRHHQQQQQQRVTVMLIAVVVVFLFCQTPQAIQNVLTARLDGGAGTVDGETKAVLFITANAFNLLVISNCCGNFVLYSTFSSKFRLTFRRLFLCAPGPHRRRRRRREGRTSDPALPLKDRRVDTVVVCEEPCDVTANGRRVGSNAVVVRLARETNRGAE